MAVLPFGIGPMELIIVLVIVLLLFGPKRLPQLGKSLGKTMKAIREGADGDEDEDDDTDSKADAAESESSEE
jgi:sec-independent protein translocase protein TatA